MAQIKDALVGFNPWWKGEFRLEYKERALYPKISRFMRLPQIIAMTGLRRVGKTTLMLKLTQDFIFGGSDAKKAVYFSFDEFRTVRLKEVIAEFEALTGSDVHNGRHLLLLDEIQKLDDWENQLKAVYDACGKSAKIVISGSESLFIRKRSKETLAGRLFEFKVEPLAFFEFLRFKEAKTEPAGLYEKELQQLWEEFLATQGMPELVGVKDREVISKYIKEGIIEKVVYRELATLFKVRDLSVLDAAISALAGQPGRVVDFSSFSSDVKVSRQTLSNYFKYLESSFLLVKLYNFSISRRKAERKLKRYYSTLLSPEFVFREDNESRSKVFEWAVVRQLGAEFFWRDSFKKEVDCVLVGGTGKPLPVEVKYGEVNYEGVLAFMKRFNIKKGYIISRKAEEVKHFDGRTIHVIPAFKLFSSEAAAATIKQEK